MQVAPKTNNKNQKHSLASRQVLLNTATGFEIVPAVIEIEQGKISKVTRLTAQTYEQDVKTRQRQTKVERHDKFLLTPAFVNAHTHLAMSFFRGLSFTNAKNIVEDIFFKFESKLSEQDVRAFSRMGAFENILNGIGCVWDHYYYGVGIADALVDTGLCGIVAPTLQDIAGPGKKRWEAGLAETTAIDTAARYQKHGVFAALGPHATDTVSPSLWKKILDSARKHQLPLHGHLAQSVEEVRRSLNNHGCSPTAFLKKLGVLDYAHNLWAHGIYTTHSDLKLLAKGKQTLVFCPFSQVIFQHLAPVFQWNQAKVNWALGTDCVASNDSMNVQKEMRFVAGLANTAISFTHASALSERLQLATLKQIEKAHRNAQEWTNRFADGTQLLQKVTASTSDLHPRASFGVLKKGAWANVLAWDLEHPSFWPGTEPIRSLAFGDNTAAIANLMIAGAWKAAHFGNFQKQISGSESYQDARTEANQRFQKLVGRKQS